MKKSNKVKSQRRLKAHEKNKARKERATEQKKWHHMVAQVKIMQDYVNNKAQTVSEKVEQKGNL